MSTRSRSLLRRPSRTVPAAVVAVVLLAVGVVAVVAAVARLTTGTWPEQLTTPAAAAAAATWNSAVVVGASIATALIGLGLLIVGIKPGAPRAALLQPPTTGSSPATDEVECVISTRSLARLAAASADTVDGVDAVSASASGRSVHLRVTTASEQAGQVQARVDDRVGHVLASAGVSPAPRLTTSVRTKEI